MTRVSGRYMCLDKQVYVTDCATSQTATHDFEPFASFHRANVLPWSSKSPDLNPIKA